MKYFWARHCESEARSNLPLSGERHSVASVFLQGDEVPKRGRLLRFARNDEFTVLAALSNHAGYYLYLCFPASSCRICSTRVLEPCCFNPSLNCIMQPGQAVTTASAPVLSMEEVFPLFIPKEVS